MLRHALLDAMTATLSAEDIREMAEARVGFRRHLLAYVLVNLFLIGVWYFSSGPDVFYWPLWVHIGWGIGIAFNAYQAYGPRDDAVEREERKLREKYGAR